MLAEANRILEEEIKLASRPQLYLVIDLSDKVVRIKGRGMELHHLPISGWAASDQASLRRLFRVLARPSISRPRTLPEGDPEADPIDVRDMPMEYALQCEPSLIVAVVPPARERPLLAARSLAREWWGRITAQFRRDSKGPGDPPRLRLYLSQEATQSLAWSLTDGMPLLIRLP
jgi:hypothetical protein